MFLVHTKADVAENQCVPLCKDKQQRTILGKFSLFFAGRLWDLLIKKRTN